MVTRARDDCLEVEAAMCKSIGSIGFLLCQMNSITAEVEKIPRHTKIELRMVPIVNMNVDSYPNLPS